MTPEQRERKRTADREYGAKHREEARARVKAWKAANPDRVRENHKKYYLRHLDRPSYRQRNVEKCREKERAYADSRIEQARSIKSKHYHANKAAIIARVKAWVNANRERRREIALDYARRHPGKMRAFRAKRRAAEFRATPAWADLEKIAAIYELAVRLTKQTGEKHVVDHYYPLRGKTVCGLHVESNLRVITSKENARKNNRHPDAIAA